MNEELFLQKIVVSAALLVVVLAFAGVVQLVKLFF
jgi:hypothetical protein